MSAASCSTMVHCRRMSPLIGADVQGQILPQVCAGTPRTTQNGFANQVDVGGAGMYGLPKDFNGAFFVGCEVELVCFAQYQVFFRFSGDVKLSVGGAFSYRRSSESTEAVIEVPVCQSDLMRLV